MAKKSSLVDRALEVSRKVRVPKKPVKTKGKKTVPAVLDWGTGIPEDKLAYLNDDEMALVQAKRTFKGKREVDGVPAFADDSASSKGVSRGDTSGTKGSTGAGAGGLGGGGKGSPGGSPGGSPSAGGSQSSPSGGQSSPSGGAGGQKATPSSGPGGGSLSAPARSAPSSAPSSPAGFGPRQSSMPGNPVSTAPSTQSWQGAVDRIAQGSSVIGNPDRQKQFTDRVPQAAPKAVNYSQTPTVGPNRGLGSFPAAPAPSYQPSDMRASTRSFSALNGPNQGLGYSPAAPGSFAQTDYSIGGNGPLSDEEVSSYDRNAQDSLNARAATRGLDTGILGPSVPAGTAIQRDPYFGAEQVANRFSGSLPSIGVNTTAYSAPIGPTLSQKLAADAMKDVFSGSPTTRSASAPVKQFTDRLPGSEAMPPGDVYKTPGPKVASGFVSEMGRNISGVGNYSLAGAPAVPSGAISIGKNVSGVGNYSQAGVPSTAPSGMGPSTQPASAAAPTAYGPTVGTVGDPYNQRYAKASVNIGGIHPVGASPMQQAEDIRRAVEITQERASSAPNQQGPIDVNGYPGPQADISPSQGDYSPSQAPAYDVSPSQQSGWTSAQRDAYLGSLGNSKTGQVFLPQNGAQPQGSPVTPAAPMTTLAPMPDWVDYSYLYNDYPQLALGATPNIGAFNQYNATFRRGGRVGDSIEAALRLALQGIVSRNKTS